MSCDGVLTLVSGAGDQLRVETRLRLTADGVSRDLDPETVVDPPAALGMLAGEATSAETGPDGALRLTIGDDVLLGVDPDPDVEAWALVRADGSRVVCTPGGDLATWSRAEVRLKRRPTTFPQLREALVTNGLDPLSVVCADYDDNVTTARARQAWILWHHDGTWDVGAEERGRFCRSGRYDTEAAACDALTTILLTEYPVYVETAEHRARSDEITRRAMRQARALIAATEADSP